MLIQMRFYKKSAKHSLVHKNYGIQLNFLQEKFRVCSNFHENNLSILVVSPATFSDLFLCKIHA